MKVTPTRLDGVLLIEPKVFEDDRGAFYESYSKIKLGAFGISMDFVQDNHTLSRRGVLRGLHFQTDRPQAKLVRVTRGEVFDVAVDIRKGSPTFGQWVGVHLSAENRMQMFIPKGFAHGFCVLSEWAEFLYKCSDYYSPAGDAGILWNDPDIGIDWPVRDPLLSDKDRNHPRLRDLPETGRA
ncbi:MAG: dTDP-4-dehydrorhamnose 3,5-epimerase [Nitrospinae bacterium CG11_big_fil_rev_8_21_14_0_20_56_8]|nr:MAG: dTDP-4-dehydrorhamnose 3,5-epimerase [Nitrospinae bacterium CG11_big_fil_rev_8_21_14_0_20_56_8]